MSDRLTAVNRKQIIEIANRDYRPSVEEQEAKAGLRMALAELETVDAELAASQAECERLRIAIEQVVLPLCAFEGNGLDFMLEGLSIRNRAIDWKREHYTKAPTPAATQEAQRAGYLGGSY